MTVLESIRESSEFLAGCGVESAKLESEWLLSHVLGVSRLQLYLAFQEELSESQTAELRTLVKWRGNREPLQHILGTAGFCGLEIRVDGRVLIPRPETETLAEEGWKFLNALERPARFLDFGTGSGCIAVAICRNAPKARGLALDRSAGALAVAAENARVAGVADRIAFLESDRFAGLGAEQPGAERFDLIVSNPPYIPSAEIAGLQPEVRDHDPLEALDGGADGLEFYRFLAAEAGAFLKDGGRIMLEFGDGQAQSIRRIFEEKGWRDGEVRNDLTGRARFFSAGRAMR